MLCQTPSYNKQYKTLEFWLQHKKMEVRATEDAGIGRDLTPPLASIAFSLLDSSLLSHCSACFSPLSPPPPHHHFPPLLPAPDPTPSVLYCSPQCCQADSDLHLSSAEHHLLHSDLPYTGDTSDLRAALRLLRHFEHHNLIPRETNQLERIGGLMSNRDKLMADEEGEDGDVSARIKDGAKAMATARRMRDGLDLEHSGECLIEEAALCVVLTNAVEVQVDGGPAVGIAVFDTAFSWINHSCSPNACYRFSLRENVGEEYGPRIIVRSIKWIEEGEEVSVAYTDLLQPKAMRQTELWLKYRFICSCQRCSASTSTYVDQILQDIFAVKCNCSNLISCHDLCVDEAIKRLNDYVDDAITDYLKLCNSTSCCEKLENLLTHGLLDGQFETNEERLKEQFWLHPFHHLSLCAYTTLASSYRTRASDLLALDPEKDELQLVAFSMSRASAAYSLLLAGATHHLFQFESSLIACAANFWKNAGESLLNVARTPVWKLFAKCRKSIADLSSPPSYKCCMCTLVDKFETNFAFTQPQNVVFENISREFLTCIKHITPKVWTVLIHGSCYLKLIKDPIDFGWIASMKSFRTQGFEPNLVKADAETSVSGGEALICVNQASINLFQLGVHCLLYGAFLSSICYGKQSSLVHYVQNLLHG